MTETPTRRGRPRGVESQHVMVRMPVDLIAQIDAYAASLQEQIGIADMAISRGMAIRELVKRGLQTVQAGPLPPQEPRPAAPMAQVPQLPSHLETVDEPEPMAAPVPAVSHLIGTAEQTGIPPYDETRFALGPLCERRHDYYGTGQTLRYQAGKHECVECKNARSRAYKERQRTARATRETA
jgi:hypothetical protein